MQNPKNQELMHRLEIAARKGEISRREFINYSVVAGLTVATAGGLWSTTAKAQPKSGGTFKWGIHDGNTSDSHDPGTYVTRQMIFLAHTHRSYLTMINGDGSLGPDIANSWEASADASQWTFKLTENAYFHFSGNKVLAKDVVASLNHHRDIGGRETTSAAKALLTDIIDIKTDGDSTVVVELSRGNADFPWLMTDYHLPICPARDDGLIDWESGDGSGPFKIEEGEFGVQFNLSRHDGWHLEGPYFDNVELIILSDPNARQTALITGDVHSISLIELKTLALLQRNSNIVVHNIPSAAAITMPMHCDTPPFDNVDIRNALKYAINRDELIEKIAFGAATIGNDFHHSSAQPYWPDNIPQRSYDPDQAKSLLKKAGAENLSIDLSVADNVFAGAVDLCVLYAEHAKAAGININVVREPNDGYYADVWLKKPFCLVSWGARPTPDVMYTLAYKEDAAWNESRWKNERFNELLLLAKAELKEERRKEMYHEMATLAKDDGGTIIPFFNNFAYANSAEIGNPDQLAPSWENDGARAASRWWFK